MFNKKFILFINKFYTFSNNIKFHIRKKNKMKILGKKSWTSLIAKFLTFFWWVECALLGLVLIAFALLYKRGYDLGLSATFTEIPIYQMNSNYKNFVPGILKTSKGTLYVHLNGSLVTLLFILMVVTIVAGVILIITHQLKMIFSDFEKNIAFNVRNIARIRNIAYTLIGYSIFNWLFQIATNIFLNTNFLMGKIDLNYDFSFGYLVFGLMLLLFSEIFKTGLLLEEEGKLTI